MRTLRLLPLSFAIVALALEAATPTAPAAPTRSGERELRFETRAVETQAHELDIQARDFAQEMRRQAREMVAQFTHAFPLDGDPAALAFVAGEVASAREIVKNAPYTAEAVTESVQVLADGNRIVRESRTLLARDAQGRTRQEKKGAQGSTVYIFDPIANRSFALHPERKTVMRLPRVPVPPIPPIPPIPPLSPAPPAPGATSLPAVPPPPSASASGAARVIEIGPDQVIVRRNADGDGKEVRVEVVRVARGDGPPLAPPSLLTLPLAPAGKGETKSLGTRDFGGINAEGTMTTRTIAAGAIGNVKPIVVTTERWFAPDLHVVVLTRTIDPRVGESSYRLVGIKREEPPAELFRIPADYKGGERR